MHFPTDDTLVIEREDLLKLNLLHPTEKEKNKYEKRWKGFCNGYIDPDLLVCKVVYFLFYGAYGSLYPLLAVYFRQLGLLPWQIGILVGLRPITEFCAAPMWGGIADTWRKAKLILLMSLFSWLVFTEVLVFIQPAKPSCLPISSGTTLNGCEYIVYQADMIGEVDTPVTAMDYPVKMSNNTIHIYSIVYCSNDIQEVFLLLMLFTILGEFFGSPTITLVDSATIGYLGKLRTDNYGRQRMFGSLGWGVLMLIEGFILDATDTVYYSCGNVEKIHKNYLVCFGAFAVMIISASVVATQIRYKYDSDKSDRERFLKLYGTTGESKTRKESDTSESSILTSDTTLDVDSTTSEEETSFNHVLRMYLTLQYGSVLFVAFYSGFCSGLFFTFLYYHLESLGAPNTLFGIASITNHTSEVVAYFFSSQIIELLGHTKSMCLALLCYVVRLLSTSLLHNPWIILPFEALQGITHALVWAAMTSYIGLAATQSLRSSAQGVLQGVHNGLGRGCGAFIGGVLAYHYGTSTAFQVSGIVCIIILITFGCIQSTFPENNDNKKDKNDGRTKSKSCRKTMDKKKIKGESKSREEFEETEEEQFID
ncbi:major facilitator superfamily domain-containing protein 6-like [Anneissia japonica]|uniref:major facilitator superfamily domain-containing protein 6-like n=1 Tax=Anneissia japonica TaxID=1529436 RepID=UPI0014257722|nr:major facilitator superfamily domain-containing protein 6-like [Anneissia japonica]